MKKIINILVSIVFLLSFIGIHIHKHYSHGQLYSTAIFAEAETCCDNMETCEMANMETSCNNQHQKDDCSCENETEVFKISDVFVSERYTFSNDEIISLFIVNLFDYKDQLSLFVNNLTKNNLTTPLVETDVQAEHCVYII